MARSTQHVPMGRSTPDSPSRRHPYVGHSLAASRESDTAKTGHRQPTLTHPYGVLDSQRPYRINLHQRGYQRGHGVTRIVVLIQYSRHYKPKLDPFITPSNVLHASLRLSAWQGDNSFRHPPTSMSILQNPLTLHNSPAYRSTDTLRAVVNRSGSENG